MHIRFSIKKMTSFLLIVIFPAVLFGCGQKAVSDHNDYSDGITANNVILDYYIWSDEESYITPVIDAYCALHPMIKIDLHVIDSATYDDQMKTLLKKDTKIDLLGIHGISSMVQFKDKGLLLDLTSYVVNNDMDVTAYGSMFNDIDINGNYYGIPTRSTCWFLLYNKGLFDAAGIAYPKQMTWEEYRTLAINLTKEEDGHKVYGGYWAPWCCNFAALQQSSYLIDDDLTPTRESLELLNDFYSVDQSHVSFDIVSDVHTNYRNEFEKGYIAMMPQGEWIINMLLEDQEQGLFDFDWDIAPMPVLEGQEPGTTWGQYQFVSIASNTNYPEEAFDFIQFLSGKDGARIYAANGIIHAYLDDEIKQIYLNSVGKPSASILFEAKRVQEQLAITGYEDVIEVFKSISNEYLKGNISIDDAMSQFENQRNAILNP